MRVAWHLRERDKARQGVVANTLNLFRAGAVGFIDWLDDLMLLEPVGFFLEFLLTHWAIMDGRRGDQHLAAAPQ